MPAAKGAKTAAKPGKAGFVTDRIAIASDHGGFALKEYIKEHLKDLDIVDLGPDSKDISVDYPDYAARMTARMKDDPDTIGILVCRTGEGMAMAANRDRSIRAALVFDRKAAIKSREHEDANIIVLAAEHFSMRQNLAWLRAFLTTPFAPDPRHLRRLAKIS